ncbi:hypothetical protein ACO0QE_001709 [Hanseniaspora vineae]
MHVDLNIQNDHIEDQELLIDLTNILNDLGQKQDMDQKVQKQVNILVFPHSQEFTLQYWMRLTNQYSIMECSATKLNNIIVTIGPKASKQDITESDTLSSSVKYASNYVILSGEKSPTSLVNAGVPANMDAIIATLLEKEGLCMELGNSSFASFTSLTHSSLQSERTKIIKEILDQIYSKFNNLQEVMESL